VDDIVASRGYALLANGMGGLDWAGVPLVAQLLGVTDFEMFLHRLTVIKLHRPGAAEGS
jgi:hypothetical protein